MNLTVSKFGDNIWSFDQIDQCEYDYLLKNYNISEKSVLIVKHKPNIQIFDFEYESILPDGRNLYLNKEAIKKCPRIRDGNIYGTLIVTFLIFNDIVHLCMVKDRTKDYLTCPGGCLDPNESYIDCAVRELFEETSIIINKSDIYNCGTIESTYTVFNISFISKSIIYYTIININDDDFKKIKNHNDDEIEYVHIINYNELEIYKDSIQDFDYVIIKYQIEKLFNNRFYQYKNIIIDKVISLELY